MEERFETLANGFLLMTSKEHRFTTDSVLLADFAHPAKREHALDLCSGCGIVPALWFAWGEAPADAFALELREDAVRLMEGTVGKNGLHGRLCPVHLDLREPFTQAGGPRFDLVTCNPPYQSGGSGYLSGNEARKVQRHESACTLDDVLEAARRALRFGGRLCICHRPARLTDLLCGMRRAGIEPKRMRFAVQHAGDAPWLVLMEGKAGAKPGLLIDPPLIMREGDAPSKELRRIYRQDLTGNDHTNRAVLHGEDGETGE